MTAEKTGAATNVTSVLSFRNDCNTQKYSRVFHALTVVLPTLANPNTLCSFTKMVLYGLGETRAAGFVFNYFS
jgi:hypothetical protein